VKIKKELHELGLPLEDALAPTAPDGWYVHSWSSTHVFYRKGDKKRCSYCGSYPCNCED